MSVATVNNYFPCDFGGSDAYNQFQIEAARQSRYEAASEHSSAPDQQPLRVLVVDGDRDGARIMNILVGMWGHTCISAHDGPAGLALADRFQPQVVLLELMLPRMDGFELAKKMRRDVLLKDCLIVAVTSYTESKRQEESRSAGIDVILLKPVISSLLKRLLSWEVTRSLSYGRNR